MQFLPGEKMMTVREVADALGVSDEGIKWHIRRLFPEMMENGKPTYLNEDQVIAIKANMKPTSQLVGAVTEKEMMTKARDVVAWMTSRISEMEKELAAAAPKLESHAALMRSERNMSITEAAKHFNLHPKTQVFPYLRERGYLTLRDLPTQAAIDADYLALRETNCPDGSVRPQAVVEARQLETWRTRVIPQIAAWENS